MKKHTTVVIALFIATMNVTTMAQNQRTKPQAYNTKADLGARNYAMALRSTNPGLVESAMMQATIIKMKFPEAKYEALEKIVDSLVLNGSTSSIRYKAYFASNVFKNPTWFAKKNHIHHEDNDEFFASVAAQLQERILGLRVN